MIEINERLNMFDAAALLLEMAEQFLSQADKAGKQAVLSVFVDIYMNHTDSSLSDTIDTIIEGYVVSRQFDKLDKEE